MQQNELLQINNLSVGFNYKKKMISITNDVSYDIKRGEILGIVGESGSGKSVTARTILQLLPSSSSKILSGSVVYNDEDLLAYNERQMRDIRGNHISMIFQEPMTSLNPLFTCGFQIVESIMLHQNIRKSKAYEKAIKMLGMIGMTMPEERMKNYPHELSGGMKQRVMIAMALCCKPKLLIADEPTTALDPTIQAQILELIKSLQKKAGMSVMYITHDLGVVADICDRIVVLYAGMIMEIADKNTFFKNPMHPYTIGLMQAMPSIEDTEDRLYTIPGMVPHISEMPEGCRFNPRCPYATELCKKVVPERVDLGNGHSSACHYAKNFEGLKNNEHSS